MLIMFSRQLEIGGKMLGWNLVGFASSQVRVLLAALPVQFGAGCGRKAWWLWPSPIVGVRWWQLLFFGWHRCYHQNTLIFPRWKHFLMSHAGCFLSCWRKPTPALETARHKFGFNRSFGFRFKSEKQPFLNTAEFLLPPTLFSIYFHPHQNLACVLGFGQWWGCQPNFACQMSSAEAKRKAILRSLDVPFLYSEIVKQPSWQKPDVRRLEFTGKPCGLTILEICLLWWLNDLASVMWDGETNRTAMCKDPKSDRPQHMGMKTCMRQFFLPCPSVLEWS